MAKCFGFDLQAQMDTSDKNPPYKSAGEQMLEAPGTEAEMDVKPGVALLVPYNMVSS